MKTINVFLDTCIVNRILDIEISKPGNSQYEEDRLYLSKIIDEYVKKGIVILIVNPTIRRQIEATPDSQKREQLLALFEQFHFTPYNKTAFSFTFPAHFVTEEEKKMLQHLTSKMPKGFKKDAKIFLDAVANSYVEVLLTTDYDDLAKKKLRDYITNKGLDAEITIFAPKEFYEYLQKVEI